MSLVEEFHAAHKARQARLGAPSRYQASIRKPVVKPAPIVLTVATKPEPDPSPVQAKPAIASSIPTPRRILAAVANEFEMTVGEMTAPSREPNYALTRFVAIGLMSDLTDLSLASIGKQLGGRDHTTILHGRNRIKEILAEEAFRNRYEQIRAGLTA
jgi:hypothetical protein